MRGEGGEKRSNWESSFDACAMTFGSFRATIPRIGVIKSCGFRTASTLRHPLLKLSQQSCFPLRVVSSTLKRFKRSSRAHVLAVTRRHHDVLHLKRPHENSGAPFPAILLVFEFLRFVPCLPPSSFCVKNCPGGSFSGFARNLIG